MWPLDYQYPTLAQGEQAIAIIWARLSVLASTTPPSNELFARAVYTATGYALLLGTNGGVIPHEAITANPEARLKEYLNPYFGQPANANMGQHVGGEHPRFDMANIDWSILRALLLAILKNLGSLPIPPVSPPAPGVHLLPLPPAFAVENASEDSPKSHLPGYPPRNIPE